MEKPKLSNNQGQVESKIKNIAGQESKTKELYESMFKDRTECENYFNQVKDSLASIYETLKKNGDECNREMLGLTEIFVRNGLRFKELADNSKVVGYFVGNFEGVCSLDTNGNIKILEGVRRSEITKPRFRGKMDYYRDASSNFELALANNILEKIIAKHGKGWERALEIIQNDYNLAKDNFNEKEEKEKERNLMRKYYEDLLRITVFAIIRKEGSSHLNFENKIFLKFADAWKDKTRNSTLKIEDLEK